MVKFQSYQKCIRNNPPYLEYRNPEVLLNLMGDKINKYSSSESTNVGLGEFHYKGKH